jgi:oligopeptide/dipeptide ABC transporter ATP-binding protein
MLLSVSGLTVDFGPPGRAVRVLEGVEFALDRGRTLALVGESGSGKSVAALSIIQLLPPGAAIRAGRVEFDGQVLADADSGSPWFLDERAACALRGARLAMIFQEPLTCLNPVLPIGRQVAEPLQLHRRLSAGAARAEAIRLLKQVGIPAAEQRIDDYPHRLSGGMRQRVMIAMALACRPALLIADEPTTALDVTIQAQILALLRDLQRQTGMALLFITHDLGVVAQLADEVAVMYAGRIVERAPVADLFADPKHPYTRGLLACLPDVEAAAAPGRRLPVIPGEPPSPARRPEGCAFHPRCAAGRDEPRCRAEVPALRDSGGGRHVSCWLADAAAGGAVGPAARSL